jgi:hypothetical protein
MKQAGEASEAVFTCISNTRLDPHDLHFPRLGGVFSGQSTSPPLLYLNTLSGIESTSSSEMRLNVSEDLLN